MRSFVALRSYTRVKAAFERRVRGDWQAFCNGHHGFFYRKDRYAGMEHQLRFINGDYSYIVYNMEGNSSIGALPISGLTVMKRTKTIVDKQCKHYAEFGVGFDFRYFPEDTEQYSAMQFIACEML